MPRMMKTIPAAPAFLPMTREEVSARGWSELDVLLITGDAYVDHPSFGAAMIGRVLEAEGLRVGIIAQPDWRRIESITGMGTPRLFTGITAGNLDSMLSNYTAARHKRKEDVYSEGGIPGKRPNHASAVYSQMARRAFPGVPIVLGGMEVSMRRVVHYDFWEDKLRPSVMTSAKGDILVYGMGETAAREIVSRLRAGNKDLGGIRGTAVLLGEKAAASADFSNCIVLPSWESIQQDKKLLMPLTKIVEAQQTPYSGKRLVQWHGKRALVMEPPAFPSTAPISTRCMNFLSRGPRIRPTKNPCPDLPPSKTRSSFRAGARVAAPFVDLAFIRASSSRAAVWTRS